jgi:glycosyltransferase involved in cell wall biosynthesis
MASKPPVVAVVCHYNMVASLKKLLKQIGDQGYDHIYVLDDASTDRSIESLPKQYKNARFILGDHNRGPAGNRNRILEIDDQFPPDAIIHFLDADVKLISQDNPTIIRQKFEEESRQLMGGKVIMPNGQPSIFNYGPRHSLYAAISGWTVMFVERLYKSSPRRANRFYHRFHFLLKDWPNIAEPVDRRPIFWCEEANLMVRYNIFQAVGGYDGHLRYHEIQDLAFKLEKIDVPRFFDAAVVVEHPFFVLNNKSLWLRQFKASWQLIFKYGPLLK